VRDRTEGTEEKTLGEDAIRGNSKKQRGRTGRKPEDRGTKRNKKQRTNRRT
jgi:hypothetical protein